jgi:hypothetical protein
VKKILTDIPVSDYKNLVEQWAKPWEHFKVLQGDYFEHFKFLLSEKF